MKLIRLATSSTKCEFDNNINQDVDIEPNSQIALHNLEIDIDPDVIDIDSTNDLQ